MVLAHNPNNLNGKHVDCMSVDFHGRPSSSIRFMGDKGIIKDGFNDEVWKFFMKTPGHIMMMILLSFALD
jgi:hypothetical protein